MSSGGGSSPLSSLTDLILVSNAGNSSFVVATDSAPSLFIDSDAKVGINTLTPASQLEVDSSTGACLTIRHNGSESAYGSLNVSEGGNVSINTNGTKVSTNKTLDIANHNGSTVGLALAGTVVQATADELNYVAGATSGSVVSGKVIIADESKSLLGFGTLSATQLSGTLQTADQSNITSVGTLTSLDVAGGVSASQLTGTLQTAAQSNITSVGTLTSLDVAGEVSAAQLTGTLQTASQPNITSVGNLSSLTVNGVNVGSELGYVSGVTAGAASASKSVVLDSNKTIVGITSLSSTNLSGTLQTAAQPNITSVGTLSSLAVTNGVSAATLTGTLQTAAQPNITSVGNLTSVSIAGSTIGAEAAFLSGSTAGAATASKALVLSSGKSITGITTLSATQLAGTLSTAAQPNITSVGNLTNVSIAGFTIGAEAAFLSSVIAGSAANSKVLVLNSSGAVSGIASLSATSLSGTLQTGAQPNITGVGTLSTLTASGSVNLTSTTDAVNASTGALKVAGGMSVVKNVFVGGTVDAAGFTVNGSPIGSSSGGSSGESVSLPTYITDITPGTASASKALVLDSSGNISGVGALDVDSLTVNGVAITESGGSGGSVSLPTYITDITPGTAAASKALVLDSSSNVSGVNEISVATVGSGIASDIPGKYWAASGVIPLLSWKSIAWSPQLLLFVAVSSNAIITSPDGVTWTSRTSPNTNTINCVCWSPELSLFVAVTDYGATRVITSPDGITWTSRVCVLNTWTSVCWSPELSLLVAVATSGSGNRVMSSPDGINWTSRSSAADNSWNSVCWSPQLSLFAAVANTGSGNRIMTSPDGINWTVRTAPSDQQWFSICWSPTVSKFVATGYNMTYSIWSSDGVNWNNASTSLNTIGGTKFVCWADRINVFIMIGTLSTYDIALSYDGINWTNYRSGFIYNWNAICWAPEILTCAILPQSYTTGAISKFEYSSVISKSPIKVNSVINSITTTTGALTINGGVGIGKDIVVGGKVKILSTTQSTDASTGALIVAGGVGVSASISTDKILVRSTLNGSAGTGAIECSGGAYIAGKLYTGGPSSVTYSATTANAEVMHYLAPTTVINTSGVANSIDTNHRSAMRINAQILNSTYTNVTTTNASTLYITGAPTGTATKNTITNSYALYVNSGNSYFGGDIIYTGTSSQSSDYRLKDNISNITYGLNTVNALRPVEYNMVSSPDQRTIGLIAHEVESVIPEIVNGTKDETESDGSPKYQSINYTGMIPVLVKAIQELEDKLVYALNRIQQLESKQ